MRDIKIQQQRLLKYRDFLWLNINKYAILNIYKYQDIEIAIDHVLSTIPPENCLIRGDFNA
jgi:hypothetical protein